MLLKNLAASQDVMWKYSTTIDKGTGVFSIEKIPENSLIISDIYRTISGKEKDVIVSHHIYDYFFVDREGYKENRQMCDLHLVFGPISIINHSFEPNCYLKWKKQSDIKTVELWAGQDISPNSELTIFYENIDEYPVEKFV